MLDHLGTRTLIVGGIATDNCVAFTSNDACLRGYDLLLLSDGCAAIDEKGHRAALAQMQGLLHAHTSACEAVKFSRRAGSVRVRVPE